ncbi:hotdog fold thioesterase [Pedobacter punctiformis]|uniref:Hotdog fold thioesterase n=1 Tax=Pedobacter punctiformis TaxID=3004097 RepID=A0ABT4L5A7_9SPHI|nr:hotdog fold thioesterase [Pedobacter sp. HCMS5-2]MCZ4243109.1 hotdog fold thioesterase [Pedobacter sp. HCMS5-2]
MWFKKYTPEELNNWPKNNIGGTLDIRYTEITEDSISGTMPVDERTHQPFGILHGGASVVLAESLGSIASFMCIDPEKYLAVGLEVNANHLRPVKSGLVTGVCKPLHIGSKTHVWEIKIYNDRGKMSCISRLTVAVINNIQKGQ